MPTTTKTKKEVPVVSGDIGTANVTADGPPAQQRGPILGPGDAGYVGPDAYARLIAAYDGAGHPVDRFSGAVIDDAVDLALPGVIPLELIRIYSSHRADISSELGVGGWSFSLTQWIEETSSGFRFRDGDGRFVEFEHISPGEMTFRRARRYDIRRTTPGGFTVYHLDTLLEREFITAAGPDTSSGRALLRQIRDRSGNKITLDYGPAGLLRIVDSAMREVRLVYDDRRVCRAEVWVDDRCHQHVDYRYHDTGELAAATDALGHTERFEYDGKHRMVKTTLKNGVSFRYEFDAETDQCIQTWGDGGLHAYTFTRIREGDQLVVTATGSGEPHVSSFDIHGNLVRRSNLARTYEELTERDADGFLLQRANAAGETTIYEYDERGNLILMTDPAGNATQWEYIEDLPCEVRRPDGISLTYVHDGFGKLVSIRPSRSAGVEFEYDRYGRMSTMHGPDGVVARFVFDERHNLVEEHDESGAVWRYTYDALGRPLSRTDPTGHVTQAEYDVLGRLVRVTYPDGSQTESEFDALGKPVRIVNQLGQESRLSYVGTGRVAERTTADGQIWQFTYDSVERLVQVKNPAHETYELSYDAMGNIIEERTFDGRKLQYDYDAAGRLARLRQPDGSWRRFEYDKLGNVIRDDSPHGQQLYRRDVLGRLEEAILDEGQVVVVSFERDELGQLVREVQGAYEVSSAFDKAGRRIKRDAPIAGTTTYQYGANALNGVAQVTPDASEFALTFTVDALGREAARTCQPGLVSLQRNYDSMSRLVEQVLEAPHTRGHQPATVLSHCRWRYDRVGRVSESNHHRWGSTHYDYDAMGRLLRTRSARGQEVFGYRADGSLRQAYRMREHSEGSEGVGSFDLGMGNLLLRTDRHSYEYDACHRRIAKLDRQTGEATKYVWDCRDRLREMRFPDGSRVRYFYDALGRRVRKERHVAPPHDLVERLQSFAARPSTPDVDVDSEAPVTAPEVTEFVWDGDQLAAEISGYGSGRAFVYYPGSFVPLLQIQRGEVLMVVTDQVGTPSELIDGFGRIRWSARHTGYGGFGDEFVSARTGTDQADVRCPLRSLGHYLDEESGLTATLFRFWDPETGRWCSPDPMGIWGGDNLFSLDGSLVNGVDPYGLCLLGGVVDVNGNEKFARWYVSGDMKGKGLDPNNPQDRLESHTERQFLNDAAAVAANGDTLVMWGRLDPCAPGCRPAIRQFVDDHPGVNASYAATETGSQWSWQQVSQDRPRAQVIQTEQRSNGDVDTRRYWQSSGSGNWTSKPYNN